MLLLCFKFVHEYLQKFRIWEDIRLKERQGQGQKRSLEARADAFSRLKSGGNRSVFRAKLYIPSTLNIDLILMHTQLIACVIKC